MLSSINRVAMSVGFVPASTWEGWRLFFWPLLHRDRVVSPPPGTSPVRSHSRRLCGFWGGLRVLCSKGKPSFWPPLARDRVMSPPFGTSLVRNTVNKSVGSGVDRAHGVRRACLPLRPLLGERVMSPPFGTSLVLKLPRSGTCSDPRDAPT